MNKKFNKIIVARNIFDCSKKKEEEKKVLSLKQGFIRRCSSKR